MKSCFEFGHKAELMLIFGFLALNDSFHFKKTFNTPVIQYAVFKSPGHHDFIPYVLINFSKMLNDGIRQIRKVFFQHSEVSDMTYFFGNRRGRFHIQEHKDSFLFFRRMIFTRKKIIENALTEVLIYFVK